MGTVRTSISGPRFVGLSSVLIVGVTSSAYEFVSMLILEKGGVQGLHTCSGGVLSVAGGKI